MGRRAFIRFLACVALGWTCSASAQSTAKIAHVGVLVSYLLEQPNPAAGVQEALRELGYVEGRNIVFDWRSARGDAAAFPKLAAELVRMKVDVIVAGTNPAIKAAQSATKDIPIVMGIAVDPVADRFVASLSRPGGNITGVSIQSDELASKRLQLLKEAFPKLSRLGILWTPNEPVRSGYEKAVEQAARNAGLDVYVAGVRAPSELDRAFTEMKQQRVGAVVVAGSTMLYAHRGRLADLAIKHRLPMIATTRVYAEAGVLLSYGADFKDAYRRTAFYVDKILKGVPAGDLPVEQPTKFDLVINLKTAGALGIKIRRSVLLRADQVIQ